MKKKVFVALTFIAFLSLVFIACKKNDDGLQVGYSNDQGTGNNPDNTSAGSTSATSTTGGFSTAGSTTSSSGGSTTSTPTGNYFKVNSTTYTCTVTGGTYNGSWSVIGRTAAGDTCCVSFNGMPAAGTYTETSNPFAMGAHECLVVVETGHSANVYMSGGGSVVVTAPTASTRKVTITSMPMGEVSTGAAVSLTASMTTP